MTFEDGTASIAAEDLGIQPRPAAVIVAQDETVGAKPPDHEVDLVGAGIHTLGIDMPLTEVAGRRVRGAPGYPAL